MRFARTTILAGAAALLFAGTAAAAADGFNTMEVALPDGSIAHVEYAGDIAPRIVAEPVAPLVRIAYDPFLALERIAQEMRARQQAMFRQIAALQQAAAQSDTVAPGGVTLVGSLPAGARVSYFSSTTDANGCTMTVQYSSDGGGAEPQVTRASSGACDAVSAGEEAVTPEQTPRQLDDYDV